MQEGTYTPPLYLDLYNFHDGAQNDIFENTTDTGPSSALPASTSSSSSGSSSANAMQPSHTQAQDAKSTAGNQLECSSLHQ
jgi:lytic polysaccharide monooxygenase AA14-like protein